MRQRWAAMILLVVLGLATAPYGMLATAQDGTEAGCADCAPEVPAAEYVPGELLVRFRPAVSKARAAEVMSAEGASHSRGIPALGVHVLRLPPGQPVEEAVERFNRRPEVDYAEPNYILQIAQAGEPGLGNQWAPQKIGAPEAWASYTKGSPEVIIAIVDTGVDYEHPELLPNRWTNLEELNGNVGQDDDLNGCIDDVRGCDFVNNDGNPMDDHFHGTHVAGIAAAAENDIDAGLVGICPNCTFMPVKVLDAEGYGDEATVAEGIIYAADNGARVISLSLRMLTAGNEPITLRDAVNHAWNQGAVVVAATGNDSLESGQPYQFYPAGHANAMGVVATDEDDYRSCYANYGSDLVSVAAPGDEIHSTVPAGDYGTYSGTSMAAPHVSGLAGLLFSYYPDNDNAWVRTRIEDTTDYFAAGASDAYLGTGRINAYAALSGDDPLTTPPPGLLSNFDTASGYAHARKLAREAGGGTLHVVWHAQAGGDYQVLHATSENNGQTWNPPEVVFHAPDETYHPALALDDDNIYVAFPSKYDGAETFRIFFTSKPRSGGAWTLPVALTGGGYDAVRPVLYLDPANGRLHMVAASLDNAPFVYYASSTDQGGQWSPAQAVDPNEYPDSSGNTRYAAVHANGSNIYIVARTVDQTLWTKYYTTFVRSTNGGQDWTDHEKLASWTAFLSGEYGLSLAGVGDRLYMGYEVGGGLYFREYTGVPWGDNTWVDLGETGAWPSITQAADGQAWMMWEDGGSLKMRHYDGANWAPAELLLEASDLSKGYYPNLKLGTGGGRVEWVYTSCKGAPYSLGVAGRSASGDDPPAVGIDDPTEGQPVQGTYRVLVSASDDNQVVSVELKIDGGAYQDITGNVQGAQYYYDWDTTGAGDGSHTLQARATDNAAQSTDSDIVNVTVDNAANEAPVASFTYTCDGLVCDFDATGSGDPDGSIDSYDWDFGDGNSGSGATTSHTYATGDARTVQLTVTDNEGATGQTSQAVDPNAPPVATFSYGCNGLVCDFDATGSGDPDGSIDSYDWDFGDGNTGSGATPSHTYGIGGTYTVQLTVTDDESATGTESQDVTVQGGGGQTVHVGDLDGDRTKEKNKWTAIVTVFVHDASHLSVPDAVVSGTWSNGTSGTGECTTGGGGNCSVSRSGLLSKIGSVDFTVDSVSRAGLSYEPAGNHEPDGDSTGTTITVYLEPPANQPPVADFSYGCTDLTCDFDASGSSDLDGSITTYAWDFGDDTTGSGMTASRTYAAGGTYTVILTVIDDGGAQDTESKQVTAGQGGGATVHVGDLDGRGDPANRGRWNATVTITVHNQDHTPLGGATVTGTWRNGASGSSECTTDGSGQCSVTKANLKANVGSVTFAVDGVSHPPDTYSSGDNHDPDGDSDGTQITVGAP